MRSKQFLRVSARNLLVRLAVLLVLGIGLLTQAQDEVEVESVTISPVMQGMEIARDIVEEDLDSPIRLRRWRFFEDNWSSTESLNLYGSFGIDSCADNIRFHEKRSDILFGWTFIFTATSGEEYQARVSYDLADSVICDEIQVPPQYAQPPPQAAEAEDGETEEAQIVASTADLAGFALGGHVAGFNDLAASNMRNARMTWVKKQVRHGISDGRDVIAQAHAQGFKVLLGALGDKNRLASDFDNYVSEFAQYVAFLAENGADAIEVWNEPNIQHEWPSGQINGAKYTRLLKAAYEAIKAVNPATLVISGAPAPTGFSGSGCEAGGCNDNVFVAQMAQAGAANYLDCVGVHYNAGSVPPNATSGAPVGSSGHYSWYLPSMMRVYRGAFPTRPLCFTELGYLTGEGLGEIPQRFAWASGNSLAEQVNWLAGAVSVARASGYVNLMIIWNVNFTQWGSDPQAGYAIVRPGGGCPACDSLRAAMGG